MKDSEFTEYGGTKEINLLVIPRCKELKSKIDRLRKLVEKEALLDSAGDDIIVDDTIESIPDI